MSGRADITNYHGNYEIDIERFCKIYGQLKLLYFSVK